MKRKLFVFLTLLLICSACSSGGPPATVLLRPPGPQPVYTNEPEVMTFAALTRFEFPSSDADMARLTAAREEKADAMAGALFNESRYTQIYGETLHMEFHSGWLYLLQEDVHPATGTQMRYLVRTNGNMTERVGPTSRDGYEFVSFTFDGDDTVTLFYIGPGGEMFYSRYSFDIAWKYEVIEEYAPYDADNPATALPDESGTRNGITAARINESDGRTYRAADNLIQVLSNDGQSWETVLTLGVETEIQMTQENGAYTCTGFAINERGDMFLSVSEADTAAGSERMLTTARRFRVKPNNRRLNMDNPICKLDNVMYKYVTPYLTVDAVRGIDYAFNGGRFYSLKGPSGCGKTTLMSLMAGLDLPTSGEIVYGSTSTRNMNLARHRRENVAVIYQSYNLLPQLTVAENVMYPMELNGVRPKKARETAFKLIETVGLTKDEFTRLPHMLSGGQQQRVAIARALGTPAKMILADEPTGNLDTENSQNVIGLLKHLSHKQGYCVVVVTHDSLVAEQADVQLTMQDGRLV